MQSDFTSGSEIRLGQNLRSSAIVKSATAFKAPWAIVGERGPSSSHDARKRALPRVKFCRCTAGKY
eukprot:2610584-Rhodomonas_salina.1